MVWFEIHYQLSVGLGVEEVVVLQCSVCLGSICVENKVKPKQTIQFELVNEMKFSAVLRTTSENYLRRHYLQYWFDSDSVLVHSDQGLISPRVYGQDPNVLEIPVSLKWKIKTKSGHNFAHTTTAELLWHLWPEWKIRMRIRAEWIFTRFQLWAH